MATDNSNPHVLVYTTVDTCPVKSSTLTGTIVSTNTTDGRFVVGTGTLFTTELPKLSGGYGYIFNASTSEVRRILDVADDTHLVVDKAFASNLSQNMVWCPPDGFSKLTLTNIGSTTRINGASVGSDAAPIFISNGDQPLLPITIANCTAVITA